MIVMTFGTRSIQLQDPEMPVQEIVETRTAFRTSMDGTVYGRRTSVRPTTLTYTFAALERIKARELEDFVAAGAGKNIRLFDFQGITWIVRFSIQSLTITTVGRGNGAGVAEFADATLTVAGSKL